MLLIISYIFENIFPRVSGRARVRHAAAVLAVPGAGQRGGAPPRADQHLRPPVRDEDGLAAGPGAALPRPRQDVESHPPAHTVRTITIHTPHYSYFISGNYLKGESPHSMTTVHALLEVTNILFSTSTYIHRTLLMCSSDKSSILSQ